LCIASQIVKVLPRDIMSGAATRVFVPQRNVTVVIKDQLYQVKASAAAGGVWRRLYKSVQKGLAFRVDSFGVDGTPALNESLKYAGAALNAYRQRGASFDVFEGVEAGPFAQRDLDKTLIPRGHNTVQKGFAASPVEHCGEALRCFLRAKVFEGALEQLPLAVL
jgi:hypothetical protein